MTDAESLVRLGETVRAWAPALQAVAVVLGLPAVALYVRRIAQHAGESARLAAATAEAAEAAKVSAITSLQTLQELQAARQAETAPYVIAYLDVTEERQVCVVVKNIGRLPARDVAVGFDPPLSDAGPGIQPWETPAFLSESIPFLPPQYELRSVLGTAADLSDDESLLAREYQTNITYTDASTHGRHTDSYTLDLRVFRHVRSAHAASLTEVQTALEELNQQQKSIIQGLADVQGQIAEPDIAPAGDQDPELPAPTDGEPAGAPAESEGPTLKHLEPETIAAAPTPTTTDAEVTPMASLCQQWRTLGQRQRWESAGSLQHSLRELAEASRTRSESSDGHNTSESATMTASLHSVLSHRFYLDGGDSLRQFEAEVDRFLSCS